MADNEIYSVNDVVLDSLARTMGELEPRLQTNLEQLITLCPLLKTVLRRCVLLLSENLRDKGSHLPLCHLAIAAALNQYSKRWTGQPEMPTCMNVSFDKVNHETLAFTEILAAQLMRLCAVSVSCRGWKWNLEDAFAQHDYLFRYLLLYSDAPKIDGYVIKDPHTLRRNILRYLLSEKLLQQLADNEDLATQVTPEPLLYKQSVMPIFTILRN